MISIVVPVFNEPATVENVVQRLLTLDIVDEIVLVDDGSDAEHAKILYGLSDESRVRLLRHAWNRGKGAALRTGFRAARSDIIVIQDADAEYAPEAIPNLVAPIINGDADVVYGSRYLIGTPAGQTMSARFANVLLTILSNLRTGFSLTDMETGHKAFKKDVIGRIVLAENRFGVEPEITAKVARAGVRIVEVATQYAARNYAAGKKIKWIDGLRALWCIFRY